MSRRVRDPSRIPRIRRDDPNRVRIAALRADRLDPIDAPRAEKPATPEKPK
jgi:hypothetical protein